MTVALRFAVPVLMVALAAPATAGSDRTVETAVDMVSVRGSG